MRTPIIAANWKMNKNAQDAKKFVREFLPLLEDKERVEILICPPFTSLYAVSEFIGNKNNMFLGAQNIFWEPAGAYTGEISGSMLVHAGCSHVLIGHSERRQVIGESDQVINKKIRTAVSSGLIPLLCVGETLEQRSDSKNIIKQQIERGLQGIPIKHGEELIIAYEPVWAIGTGINAGADDAQKIIQYIRELLEGKYGENIAGGIRILYGGSVKEGNIAEFMAEEDIDGALVGGASLDPVSFAGIVRLGENA